METGKLIGIWIIGVVLFNLLIVGGFLIFKDVSYQHGSSRDIVMGFDKGIYWHHAYLKNDHLTAYCFDDERFIPLLEQSQKEGREVIITYEKYIGRGNFCSAGDYEKVVITNVEFA